MKDIVYPVHTFSIYILHDPIDRWPAVRLRDEVLDLGGQGGETREARVEGRYEGCTEELGPA